MCACGSRLDTKPVVHVDIDIWVNGDAPDYLLHEFVPEQSIANLMGCVFWGWKPGTFSGWLSCAYIELDSSERFFFPNNSCIAGNHKNGKGVLTIERSRAVIADPCDRPMTPSYSFFDSSLDHHFTWLHSISLNSPKKKVIVWTVTYGIIPSTRCWQVVLQFLAENPPGPRGWCRIVTHWRTIDVMESCDVRKLVLQRAGVTSNCICWLDITMDNCNICDQNS